ncbi:MAG: glycoside hydrolase family 125 protein [bacterium]
MGRPAPRKPWDVGDGHVAAAVGSRGQVVSVHGPHPRRGWVHLSGFPLFDEERRYDPEAVRAYRRTLEDPEGPGLQLEVEGLALVGRRLVEDAVPEYLYRGRDLEARCVTFAAGGRVFLWLSVCGTGSGSPARVRVRVTTSWGLARAAYAQVTEGGPLPVPDPTNRLRWVDGALVWEAPGLPAWAVLRPVPRVMAKEGPPPLHVSWDEELCLTGGAADRVLVVELWARPPDLRSPVPTAQDAQAALEGALRQRRWGRALPRNARLLGFVRRQLLFVLDVCAVQAGDATCLVTDPVLLPLSWNRDAYYMACLLGAAGRLDGPLAERARAALAGHLRWLFRVAHRPSGWWARSYLTNGEVKDAAFQLDQQWYPVLEVVRAAVDWNLPEAWSDYGGDALEVARRLVAARHPNGLWPTSETPADDPLPLRYHLSSHVLAWRTMRMLARVDPEGPWEREAARLRQVIFRVFTTPEGAFAYATDGTRFLSYHDANDLPLACAPHWGFCTADDPAWRRTLRFAWSPENAGFFPGRYGGLGSVHAPGPWTLGDVQAWVAGVATRDGSLVRRAWRRLREVAFDDGLLCESYDPETGWPRTRAWFAWPGAAAAALLLGDCL